MAVKRPRSEDDSVKVNFLNLITRFEGLRAHGDLVYLISSKLEFLAELPLHGWFNNT